MWCNQIFSLINNSTIENIIVCDNYELANQIAKTQYGESAYAEDTTQYPVSIGCRYIDGIFYQEDGITVIERNPTEAEEVAALQAENSLLTQYVIDLDYRLSLKELGV